MSAKNIPVRSIKAEPSKGGLPDGFRIRTLGEVLAGRDLVHDLHRHDFYFVLFVARGSGVHEIDFVEHRVTRNSLFILRPGQVHRLSLKAGSEGYLMEFGKAFISPARHNDLFHRAVHRNFFRVNTGSVEKMQRILKAIHEESHGRHERFLDAIKANLLLFLVEILRQDEGHAVSSPGHADYAQQRLQEFFRLLEAEFRGRKTVSWYADKLNLSPFQLNSIARSLMGKTASALIDDHVLLEAKRYLLATSNQVNQIAYHLGYEDVSYFIRFFRKHTGQSPEMFRQNFR